MAQVLAEEDDSKGVVLLGTYVNCTQIGQLGQRLARTVSHTAAQAVSVHEGKVQRLAQEGVDLHKRQGRDQFCKSRCEHKRVSGRNLKLSLLNRLLLLSIPLFKRLVRSRFCQVVCVVVSRISAVPSHFDHLNLGLAEQ